MLEQGMVTGGFEEFLGQVLKLVKTKDRLNVVYEPDQIIAAEDEIKYEMLKTQINFHKTLTKTEKDLVESCFTSDKSFDWMVEQVKNDLTNKSQKKEKKQFWMGTRMEVEMPDALRSNEKKKIEPEILSQKFMFTEDYHHYDDWKTMMEETYDQFNLI